MVTDERLNTLLVDANPVPDVQEIELVEIGAAVYLNTIEQRSSEVTQLETKTEPPKKKTSRGLIVVLAAAAAVILGVTVLLLQDDEAPVADDPVSTTAPAVPTTVVDDAAAEAAELLAGHAALLDEFAAASNSGDISAAMASWDTASYPPEMRRHPYISESQLWDTSAVTSGVEHFIAAQGSGSGIEFFVTEVSDGSKVTVPDISFNWKFVYGADGSESGGEAGCIGGKEGRIFLRSGKISSFDWGFDDPSQCDS